jgi:dTDP-4-dehydrorhamnose reductase
VRLLVTGHNGLLGSDLTPVLAETRQVTGCSLPERDITDPETCRRAVREARPELVIHAAAFTAVDECERHPGSAWRVNALGTRNVALAAREAGVPLAYISTDYVFDGRLGRPYVEFDPPGPLGIYGRSKWAGEQYVRQLCPEHYIVRSAWLFGAGGPCFPQTILRLVREKGRVEVVTDQVGNPTWCGDLARAVARIVVSGLYGTWHAVNEGPVSWFEFARGIVSAFGGDPQAIQPTTTDRFPRPAPRPPNSSLDNFVLRESLGMTMRPWPETLPDYAAALARPAGRPA